MNTIHKYPLARCRYQDIETHEGAELLCVQVQHGAPMLWASVDTSKPRAKVRLMTVGTGQPFTAWGRHLGSYQLSGGDFVWHVFES